MANRAPAKSSRDKVRAHRARLRRQGLRPVQFWLPNPNSRSFAREAHAQSLAVARSHFGDEDQAFIDTVTDWGGR